MSALTAALADSAVITKRNLIKIKRVPDLLVFATLSPIMFVLLFRYVFGGAIQVPGNVSYAEFLLPGIFAQTVIFGSTLTGFTLAQDLQQGLIDRFRSLPMSRSAVLIGRTVADGASNIISITVMAVTGVLVGWRVHTSALEALGGFLLLLLFAYSISWLMAMVGLLVRTPEVVNNAAFIVIFPLTFLSNAFVPLESLPSVLQTFAEWNPVSTVVQAMRELFGNTLGPPPAAAWPMQHAALYTLLWAAVFLAVFVPLSVRQYRRAASR
jgi:ABC-2 type transport system permease protein